jgi:hypothetical protein
VNQQSTSIVGITVQAASSATANAFTVKDSAGNARGGFLPAGTFILNRFTSAPSASASNAATLYYDESGGSNDGMLALSRDGAAYQFVISVATDGSNGQCLKTNGSKVFSFGACAAVSLPNTEIGYGNGSAITSSDRFTWSNSVYLMSVRNASGTVFELDGNTAMLGIYPFGTSAGNTTPARFFELAANGTNYFGVKAGDSMAASYTMVWPTDTPSVGETLRVSAFASNIITTEWASGACPGGDNKEVVYNNSGACNGADGFEYQAASSPHVRIQGQADGITMLEIQTFDTTPTVDLFRVRAGTVGNIVFAISSDGDPYTPQTLTASSGEHFGFNSGAGDPAVAFGNTSSAAIRSVAVGYQTTAVADSVVIGHVASTTNANELVIGSGISPLYEVRFGSGSSEVTGTVGAITLYGVDTNNANTAGGDIVLSGGKSRGTGATTAAGGHGSVRTRTYTLPGTSGINQGSAADRLIIDGQKLLVSADNTAQSLFEVALPTLAGTAGKIFYEVYINDGTDVQELSGSATFSAVNKAGTYTTAVADDTPQKSLSAGTLTATSSIVTGTNKITFKITPDTSLTPASASYWIHWTCVFNHEQTVTILP